MDYGAIIKRAWRITWDHKVLWVLGLFAGATGGGWGRSGTGYRFNSQDLQLSQFNSTHAVYSYMQEWAPVILAAIVLLFLLAIVWAVISLAAQGGLVHQVNEAAEDRQVRLGTGWSAGFHFWGRLAISGLLLLLPLVVIGTIGTLAGVATLVLPSVGGSTPGTASWIAFSAVMLLLIPITIVAGFLLGNLYSLAVRFIVIENRHATDSISAAWGVIRRNFKEVFLVWLITVGLSIGFGLAIVVPVLFFGVGIGVTVFLGAWPVAVLVGLVLIAVLMVVGAAFSTFTSALWTIFFRRVTGREPARAPAVWAGPTAGGYPSPGYSPAGPSGGYPPATYPPSGGYPPPTYAPPAGPVVPTAPPTPPAAPVPPPVAGADTPPAP